MKSLMILARRHGSKSLEVLSGPEVPYYEQRNRYRKFLLNRTHPEFEAIELHGVYREQAIRLVKPVKKEPKPEGNQTPGTPPPQSPAPTPDQSGGASAGLSAEQAPAETQALPNPVTSPDSGSASQKPAPVETTAAEVTSPEVAPVLDENPVPEAVQEEAEPAKPAAAANRKPQSKPKAQKPAKAK